MKKINEFLMIGLLMLVVAIIFVCIAINNPQMSFSINVNILYGIYAVYLILMFLFIVLGLTKMRKA